MAKFKLEQKDPTKYKTEILRFWDNYLPGTPHNRFDWMNKNPDGTPIWFMAFEVDSGEIAGTVSIMPREVISNGVQLRAGIVGDFMIANKYRVFGPAMDLQKKVIASMKDHDIDFIYTLPNKASVKLEQRVGLQKIADLNYYIKPISLEHYLNKYMNSTVAAFVSPIVGLILKLVSKETYIFNRGDCREINAVDTTFDTFWQNLKRSTSGFLRNYSTEYLKWRYLDNPTHDYSILTYRSSPDGQLEGYLVFNENNSKFEIFDIIAMRKRQQDILIKKLIRLAKIRCIQSINIRLSDSNELQRTIRYFGFLKSKDDVCILAHGMDNNLYQTWSYVEGDRNI